MYVVIVDLVRYFVVGDQRVHPSEGGLERREPIRRLFRDIQKDHYTVYNSLLLSWENPTRQRGNLEGG